MRRVVFEPMRGLTLAVLICLPILIGLGAWQFHRLQWKTDLLAEIEAAANSAPLDGLAGLDAAIAAGEPVDFRRIRFGGRATGPAYHLYAPAGSIQWKPFRVVESDGRSVLAAFASFDDRVKGEAVLPTLSGVRAGYVRRIRPAGGLSRLIGSASTPELNRWFEINPDGAWLPGAEVFIDIHPTEADPTALPVRIPDIANNHLSYMLTWWSFAIILLVIYGILHTRAGRLRWA